MPKKQKTNAKGKKFSKGTAIGIGIAVVAVAAVAYFAINSSTDGGVPFFTPAKNNFIVAKYYQDGGYAFTSKATTSGKKSSGGSSVNPTIYISKGSVEAIHMINEGTTEDEMFVMTFSRNIDTASELTLDRRTLQNAMFGLHAQGATALWDAVNSAIDSIKRGKHRKKALLVITDGSDNKSVLNFSRVLDRVRESDLMIYTVGIIITRQPVHSRKAGRNVSSLSNWPRLPVATLIFPRTLRSAAKPWLKSLAKSANTTRSVTTQRMEHMTESGARFE